MRLDDDTFAEAGRAGSAVAWGPRHLVESDARVFPGGCVVMRYYSGGPVDVTVAAHGHSLDGASVGCPTTAAGRAVMHALADAVSRSRPWWRRLGAWWSNF